MIGFGVSNLDASYAKGSGYIAGEAPGIVSIAGTPASRRIVLFEKSLGRVVGRVGSAADGTYRFDRVGLGRKYAVIAFDHTGQFNAVIRDDITPAVDP